MRILFEDNHIIVAVKPQNMPSQADASGDPDFLNAVKEYVRIKYKKPGAAYIGLVHRLDRPAGGLMVFARTSKAAKRLAEQMKSGAFHKVYAAVTAGRLPAAGSLEDWLTKDAAANRARIAAPDTEGAKRAALAYEVTERREGFSLLRIELQTGRPHQIRVQFAHAGAPLVGDRKYGGRENKFLCLWARELSFLHPTKGERLTFSLPLPGYFPFSLF